MSDAFCLLHARGTTRLVTGEVRYGKLLADLPRPTGLPVISMVPYSQLRERGFVVHDSEEPLISLVATDCREVDLDALLDGPEPPFQMSEVTLGTSDADYAAMVRRVVDDEIRRGEGSNFLISRTGGANIEGFSPDVARTIFRRLVRNEPGAYLTFCFFDGERYFIGSSPERHLTFVGTEVTMNPISGTLPKRPGTGRAELLDFLTDPKEINELFQVVDEELKMMSRICSAGGTVRGPYLKEMGSLVHTEYELVGHSTMDKVDAFRESMFAATMIGSPLENAARVIHRHEDTSRRYYSSALVVHGLDEGGAEYLDSAITIRTMEVTADGRVALRSGGSIVRDSDPEKETREASAKMAGLLRAASSAERTPVVLPGLVDAHVEEVLRSRNGRLSRFWTDNQQEARVPAAPGARILVVDNEDEFTRMLAHVLTHLGHTVTVGDHDDPGLDLAVADLVLVGPGPGDPTDPDNPRMRRVRQIVADLLAADAPFLAVCLGHQIVCQHFGFDIAPVDPPLQGVQRTVDLFGRPEAVGFYNTYFARVPAAPPAGVRIAADGDRVVALRGRRFRTFQFHVESVLTTHCEEILREAVDALLEGGW
ncbi:phenazine-specific anthranilate synthase component I [Longispora fulva]|uniref:anthranilate synthase n=1 Tax=Longispora fulva TaxID=619741 RepID=A0A8J7GCB1_9ACTN|nr:anthranilate synthase family protein [Longispora fulva]MBG6135954.1 phenazine biosynthesis protein phzE [Longispora fulva]GIG55802.1 phenazine-specific anthranilate synthase component I [Longispora fulva]